MTPRIPPPTLVLGAAADRLQGDANSHGSLLIPTRGPMGVMATSIMSPAFTTGSPASAFSPRRQERRAPPVADPRSEVQQQ
jgi:hypothetical protein